MRGWIVIVALACGAAQARADVSNLINGMAEVSGDGATIALPVHSYNKGCERREVRLAPVGQASGESFLVSASEACPGASPAAIEATRTKLDARLAAAHFRSLTAFGGYPDMRVDEMVVSVAESPRRLDLTVKLDGAVIGSGQGARLTERGTTWAVVVYLPKPVLYVELSFERSDKTGRALVSRSQVWVPIALAKVPPVPMPDLGGGRASENPDDATRVLAAAGKKKRCQDADVSWIDDYAAVACDGHFWLLGPKKTFLDEPVPTGVRYSLHVLRAPFGKLVCAERDRGIDGVTCFDGAGKRLLDVSDQRPSSFDFYSGPPPYLRVSHYVGEGQEPVVERLKWNGKTFAR